VEIKGVTASTPQTAAAPKLHYRIAGGDNGSGASSALYYYVRYHDSLRF